MGGGRVGLALANLLIDEGYDITLIESDESLCSEVAAELDALVICGNGTNSKVLEEINAEDADYFIATKVFIPLSYTCYRQTTYIYIFFMIYIIKLIK